MITNQRYLKAIYWLRIAAAVLFAVGGACLLLCAHLRIGGVAIYVTLGLILGACVLVGFLVLEQLGAIWFSSGLGRFSIGSLMSITALAGGFFAIFRNGGWLAVVVVCLVLCLVSALLEGHRRAERGGE